MKLVSVNVSRPKTVDHLGRQVSTGICNEPAAGWDSTSGLWLPCQPIFIIVGVYQPAFITGPIQPTSFVGG